MNARRLLRISVFATLACALLACDDGRPRRLTELQPTTTQSSRPTTQELLSGEQTRTSLKTIPFWVTVPKSWQVKPADGVFVLSGPTPSGMAQIQVGRHSSPIAKHAQLLIEQTKKEAEKDPGPYTLADVRTVGGISVLEMRKLGKTKPSPAIDAAGTVIASTSTPLEWKINAFVPNGKDTDVCELYFIDLTREQYDLDKDLLQKIVASLEYDPKI